MDTATVDVGAGQQDARAHQFEVEPGCGGAAHVGQPGGDDLGGARQFAGAHSGGLRLQAFGLVTGDVDEAAGHGIGYGSHDHQVTQPTQEVFGETTGILTDLDHLVDGREDTGGVARCEGVDDLVEQGVGRVAQQGRRLLVADAIGPGPAQELVEDAERISHRTRTRTHHQGQDGLVDRDALLRAQLAQVGLQHLRRHEAEGVVVGARTDRPDDLLGLGRREDELDVRRGLLDELQHGVEASRRHHVRLVDDVDLVAAVNRREEGAFTQVARVFDTTVTGGVDLDDVDGTAPTAGKVAAALADPARGRRGALLTVEAAGQDAGAGGLAAAARPTEQVGVVDLVVTQSTLQWLGDVLLADHLGEALGTVAAVERQGCGRGLVDRARLVTGCGRFERARLSDRRGVDRLVGKRVVIDLVRVGGRGVLDDRLLEQPRAVLIEEVVAVDAFVVVVHVLNPRSPL